MAGTFFVGQLASLRRARPAKTDVAATLIPDTMHSGIGRASMIYETCVDSVAGVRAAKAAGAQRVELCADLLEGGITPSRGTIRQARKVPGIDLNVMIRPRGGDFLFDDDEFATMRSEE